MKNRRGNRSKLPYTNLVIIQNKGASNSERASKLAQELRAIQQWSDVAVVDISGFNTRKTFEIIESAAQKFTPQTIVGVGGGDGTVSGVVHVLATSDLLSDHNIQATLLPLWGGNANDLGVMINGLINTTSLKKVLAQSHKTNVYPLLLSIKPPVGTGSVRTAICYVSFGASAHILERMEHSSHKRNQSKLRFGAVRLVAEILDVGRSIFAFRPVHMQAQKRRTATMYDRIFVNGSRFAKVFRSPVALDDNAYFEMAAYSKGYRYVVDLFSILFKVNGGRVTDETQKFRIKTATMCQIDGEIMGLEADTNVEIGLHDRPIIFLSRKLKSKVTT